MKKIYIPNSKYFSAIPTGNDKFMENCFDLISKEHDIINIRDPEITKANKYLRRMYKRLDVYATKANVRGFYVIAMILLKRSVAFRLAAITFKWKHWFRKGTGSKAKKIATIVKSLSRNLETAIEYKRLWIPKGLDRYGRPLGCPTVPWRIYLWMFYFLLDVWISNNQGRAPWQHGGFSKRGPNTFFDQLIGTQFYKRKWIYEFDLKGYFNNIKHKAILEALVNLNLPEFMKNHCEETLKARPTTYGKMPSDYLEKARAQWGVDPITGERFATQHRWDLLDKETMTDEELYNAMNYPAPPEEQEIKEITIEIEYSDGTKETKVIKAPERKQASWENKAHDWIHGLRTLGVGTPQGVSYSPLLTSVASSYHAGLGNKNLIMYMDDGIIAAETEEELNLAISQFEESANTMGVELARNKSGMVKQDGVWLKDLKIIGFRIDRFLDWVFSSTRSGKEIPMPLPNYEQLREYYTSSERPTFTKEDRMELIEALQKLDKIPEGSRARFIEWIEASFAQPLDILKREAQEEEFNPLTTHEIMVDKGKSGKMLNHIWNPNEKDIRDKINDGVRRSIEAIAKNPKSFVYDKLGPHRIDQLLTLGPEGLRSLSTEMSKEYLKWEARKKENLRSPIMKNTGTLYTLAGVRRSGRGRRGW